MHSFPAMFQETHVTRHHVGHPVCTPATTCSALMDSLLHVVAGRLSGDSRRSWSKRRSSGTCEHPRALRFPAVARQRRNRPHDVLMARVWAGLDVTAHVGTDDVDIVGPTGQVRHTCATARSPRSTGSTAGRCRILRRIGRSSRNPQLNHTGCAGFECEQKDAFECNRWHQGWGQVTINTPRTLQNTLECSSLRKYSLRISSVLRARYLPREPSRKYYYTNSPPAALLAQIHPSIRWRSTRTMQTLSL